MSGHAFEKLEGAKARKFIERLNKSWAGSPFDPGRTVVHMRKLSFADSWSLAEASDAMAMPEKKCAALDNGRECTPIEFSSDFIPAFAAKQGLRIDSNSAPDYLRFWFEYARAGADRFMLVEAIDDIPWREDPSPQSRKGLAKAVTPLTFVSSAGGKYHFKACVLFRDALFDCALDVSPKGAVAITDRQLIAEGLTVTDPLTGF